MNLQMKRIREAKGLSQQYVASKINVPVRRYGSWEREERKVNFEDACRIADVLECSLDELAGREWRGERFADPGKNALVGYYDSMNDRGRATLVESARLMSDGDSVRIEKDGAEDAGISTAMGA